MTTRDLDKKKTTVIWKKLGLNVKEGVLISMFVVGASRTIVSTIIVIFFS